jgi:hypothetical protein
VAQDAVCSQTNTKHINTVWAERTVVKMFNLLVHLVTSRYLCPREARRRDQRKLHSEETRRTGVTESKRKKGTLKNVSRHCSTLITFEQTKHSVCKAKNRISEHLISLVGLLVLVDKTEYQHI